MSRWDRSRSHDAFLADLARRGIGPEYLPRYGALVIEFVRARAGVELDALGPADVEAFVEGRPPHEAAAARTAATEFVNFIRAGGLVPLGAAAPPSSPPAPRSPSAPSSNNSSVADMFADMQRVFTLEGLATAVAVSAPLLMRLLGTLMGLLGGIIYLAALAGAYFSILDHVASGRDELPKAADESLGRKFWRGLMVTIAGCLPLIVLSVYAGDLGLSGVSFIVAGTGAVILGALLLPAASLAVYAADAGLAAIAPHLWVRIIARMPGDYMRVALLYLPLFATFVIVNWLHAVPWVGWLIVPVVRGLIVFSMAAALGGVVRRNRSELGI